MNGDNVFVRVKTPIMEKYKESKRLTIVLSKYLKATYKLKRAMDPTIGNLYASVAVIVSFSDFAPFLTASSSIGSLNDRWQPM